jgi:hypothetical protein
MGIPIKIVSIRDDMLLLVSYLISPYWAYQQCESFFITVDDDYVGRQNESLLFLELEVS